MRSWLARGVDLEVALQLHGNDHQVDAAVVEATVGQLREVMAAWVRQRSLLAANISTAALLRSLVWVKDAVLVDAAHWALGPFRWCGP